MTAAVFDRELLRRRRQRALLSGVPVPTFLIERVADDFIDRLSLIRRAFPLALDLGANTGLLCHRLRRLPGIACVIASEATPALLALCDPPKVLADEEALPFAAGAFDLVVSGLALHFVNDLPGTLIQIRRCLKPDGLLLAALLGGRTLHELRHALMLAETELEGGASPRVAPFADVRDLGQLLQRAELALPVVDSDVVTVTYATPLALLHDLRALGATNVLRDRRRQPLRRATLLRALQLYADQFATPAGRVTATFEIMTLTAWAPHASQQRPLQPGSGRVSLVDVLGKA